MLGSDSPVERVDYSILKLNSWVASTSPASAVHLYCNMALRTAVWKTRGPDKMVTSLTTPSLIKACARTTPPVPSCKALRGMSGATCVGQATPISALGGTFGGGGAGGAGGASTTGGGGAITTGSGGGVATAVMTGAADTGGVTSVGGTNGGGGATILGAYGGGSIFLGGGVAAAVE